MKLSRTCLVADHYSKDIEYVCVYPQCEMHRFLCSKCKLGTNHKHSQSDNSHILDNRDFYEMIKNNLSQAKGEQQYKKFDIEKSIVTLKQLINEIQNFLKNVQNITQQVEQGKLSNININNLEDQLLNIQIYGFNQIDDQSLNNFIKLSEQQQGLEIYKQLQDQANLIIQNALKIKEWRLQQVDNRQSLQQLQKIQDAKYQIKYFDDPVHQDIYTGAISNNLKYIVSGGEDKLLKIWNYETNKLIKSIELNNYVLSCKFTEDSTYLFAGSNSYLYQFDVQNQFKELYKQIIHNKFINCIYCITNSIILTASNDKTIIKTDVDKNEQLLNIQKYNCYGSEDKSIKLWNGNDGSLIIEKQNAHNNDQQIEQVIISNDQLISLCYNKILVIWNFNYQTKQLEQVLLIKNAGVNISLVLQQQYIITTEIEFIKVYSIKGVFVRQFDHEINYFSYFNTIQLDSMKAVLIKGRNKLQVCKIDMD